MPHKLADVLRSALKTRDIRIVEKPALEACGYLDRIADKASAAGKAAAGNSGRQKVEFDVKAAKRMRNDGKSLTDIAKALGVSYGTARNRLAE